MGFELFNLDVQLFSYYFKYNAIKYNALNY